jgi:FkbM family methyltransferase
VSLKLVARSVWNNPGNRGRRWRKTLRAVGWQVHKRVRRSPRFLQLANGVRFRAYPDCVVSSALIYADWPEFAELMFLRRFLRPGEAVLDIGANVGHISLLLADVVGPENLYAFEPTPVTFKRLVENWELNGWATDQLFEVAIGSSHGSVELPDVSHPLTTNAVATTPSAVKTACVPLLPLDAFRSQLADRRIGLLKLDIEGYEAEALAGGRELLLHERPRLIMFESLGGRLEESVGAIFEDVRYAPFSLDAGGLPDGRSLAAQNLFAVPAENLASIPGMPARSTTGASA